MFRPVRLKKVATETQRKTFCAKGLHRPQKYQTNTQLLQHPKLEDFDDSIQKFSKLFYFSLCLWASVAKK